MFWFYSTGFVRRSGDVIEKKHFQLKISDYVKEATTGTDDLQPIFYVYIWI
jgi:hypothetical protein